MNLVLTVLQVVTPVFALAAIGFGWVRAGYAYDIAFVTRLTMTLSVPCLIFVALMETEADPVALATLLAASVVSYGIVGAVFAGVVAVTGLERRTFLAPLIFGNTGNVGLPLALFAFGREGLGLAVVVFAVMAVGSFTIGIRLVAGAGSMNRVLREPMVGATLAGALFLWAGWTTPPAITETLRLTGQMAIPLMLLTLGVAIARLQTRGIGRAIALSALKAGVCVSVAAGVGLAFALPPVAFAVLVLQIATPVAVTSYMLAEKYGADAQSVAALVVASTVMAVGLLPLILASVL